MININSFKQFESKVDKKIQLLQDLSLDLIDKGLQVEVINGSNTHLLRDPRITIHSGSRYSDEYKKSIIMRITDDNNLFNADLYYTDTIQDFIETLKSYGMNPRSMSGGNHFAVFKFDKWSKMTDSDYFKDISESIDYDDIIYDVKMILSEFEDYKINFVINNDQKHLIVITIDSESIHSITDGDDSEEYDVFRDDGGRINSENIHIIEQCVSYLKSNLKPLGKNILDDLDVHFLQDSDKRRWLTHSYPRFIHYIKSGKSVRKVKFSFIK
jgi:hypothetical protein